MRQSNGRAVAATPAAALGREGRGRVAPAEGGLRAIHQRVLRSFATVGHPPSAADLAETAARCATTAEAVLAALHAEDFLQLAAAQHGKRITVKVTASLTGYATATATSKATAKVATGIMKS